MGCCEVKKQRVYRGGRMVDGVSSMLEISIIAFSCDPPLPADEFL